MTHSVPSVWDDTVRDVYAFEEGYWGRHLGAIIPAELDEVLARGADIDERGYHKTLAETYIDEALAVAPLDDQDPAKPFCQNMLRGLAASLAALLERGASVEHIDPIKRNWALRLFATMGEARIVDVLSGRADLEARTGPAQGRAKVARL